MNAQRKNPTPSDDNPLGRVLKVYDENKDVDVETLELKLGEAILGETPQFNQEYHSDPGDFGGCTAYRSVRYGNRYDRDVPGNHALRCG